MSPPTPLPEGMQKELKNDDVLDEKHLSEADVQATFIASSGNSTEAETCSPEYSSISTNQKSTEVGLHTCLNSLVEILSIQ